MIPHINPIATDSGCTVVQCVRKKVDQKPAIIIQQIISSDLSEILHMRTYRNISNKTLRITLKNTQDNFSFTNI